MPKLQHFYTTSQAGRLLGVTDDTIRRWTAEGRIEAETTPGGQMRIPVDEIRRVRAEGSLLPRSAPTGPRLRPGSEAARLAEQLETERLRLKLERMQRQREEAETRARLEERRRRQEAEEAERQRREAEEAERRLRIDQERRDLWRRRAARRFEPLPAEARLAALEVFETRLRGLDPLPEDGYLSRLLDAVEEAARLPGRVEAENQRLMQQLLEERRELAREPQHADLRDQALVRMHEALRRMDLEAPLAVREAAARQALEPVLRQYRRRRLLGQLGEEMEQELRRAGATAEELARARAGWQQRGAQLAEAEEPALRAAAGELRQAMRARVAERRQAEREARQREEEQLMESVGQSDCRRLARFLLSAIVPEVLRKLERAGELEFESSADYRDTCEAIQSRLAGRESRMLLEGADPVSTDTRSRIERMVDAEIDEVAEPVDGEDAED